MASMTEQSKGMEQVCFVTYSDGNSLVRVRLADACLVFTSERLPTYTYITLTLFGFNVTGDASALCLLKV